MRPLKPLTPAVLHILMVLSQQDRHGYAVMQAVREQSGGQVPLRTGTFYRHLSQLIAVGLVEESPDHHPDDDPRRGAYYRVTARGRRRLVAEGRRLAELVAAIGASASRKGHA